MADNHPSLGRFNFSNVVPSNILASLAISIVCPYVFYQFLMQHNVAIFTALSIVAIFPFAVIILFLLRQRTVDLIGLVALLWIVFLVITSFITPYLEDTRLTVLLKVAPVGIIGVVFLLSQFLPHSFLFYVDRYFSTNNQPDEINIYQQIWRTNADYRRRIKLLNGIWGGGLLVDFLLVALLLFLLASAQTSFIVPLVIIGIPATLLVFTVQYKGTMEQKEQVTQTVDEE